MTVRFLACCIALAVEGVLGLGHSGQRSLLFEGLGSRRCAVEQYSFKEGFSEADLRAVVVWRRAVHEIHCVVLSVNLG